MMRKMVKRLSALLLTLVLTLPASVSVLAGPVHVFYSSIMKDYLLTASESERSSLEADFRNGRQTYQYAGILGYAEDSGAGNVPVYRFWNKDTMDHFYTISEAERQKTEENYWNGIDGYAYEGVAFYVPSYGYTPVYRFFDVYNFSHIYTSDERTKNTLISDWQSGVGNCRYEGVAWYW